MTIQASMQHIHTFKTRLPANINSDYLVYLPRDYDPQQGERWPFIFFLHGGGESGSDIERVKLQGLPKQLQDTPDFPFVVISPQSSNSHRWSISDLTIALDELVEKYAIDPERMYVTGLSMGGYATWDLAMAHPQRFAAIAPICGGGNVHNVCRLKHLPVWAFHGAKDTVVPIAKAEVLVKTLKRCGGNVRFTVYPDVEHDSWTETYENPELYMWFLEHIRQNASSPT